MAEIHGEIEPLREGVGDFNAAVRAPNETFLVPAPGQACFLQLRSQRAMTLVKRDQG